MKAPKKVIAAMAMATLLGTGATSAFADTVKFTPTTGDAQNGKNPLQRAEDFNANSKDDLKTLEGDIKINGEFSRTVTNFPAVTQNGHYLRVTMPISLDYKYNLDDDTMISAKGTITNESVLVEDLNGDNENIVSQPVKMSIVDIQDVTDNTGIKYVEKTNPADPEVQLPFELVVTTNGGKNVDNISLASIKDANVAKTIDIGAGADLGLEIKQINKQSVVNMDEEDISIGHSLKLQFEYNGQ